MPVCQLTGPAAPRISSSRLILWICCCSDFCSNFSAGYLYRKCRIAASRQLFMPGPYSIAKNVGGTNLLFEGTVYCNEGFICASSVTLESTGVAPLGYACIPSASSLNTSPDCPPWLYSNGKYGMRTVWICCILRGKHVMSKNGVLGTKCGCCSRIGICLHCKPWNYCLSNW